MLQQLETTRADLCREQSWGIYPFSLNAALKPQNRPANYEQKWNLWNEETVLIRDSQRALSWKIATHQNVLSGP